MANTRDQMHPRSQRQHRKEGSLPPAWRHQAAAVLTQRMAAGGAKGCWMGCRVSCNAGEVVWVEGGAAKSVMEERYLKGVSRPCPLAATAPGAQGGGGGCHAHRVALWAAVWAVIFDSGHRVVAIQGQTVGLLTLG